LKARAKGNGKLGHVRHMQRYATAFSNATPGQTAREAFGFICQPLVRPDVFADLEGYALRARSRMLVQRL
jgi:hypothetical protein